jgi:hypothetical protein
MLKIVRKGKERLTIADPSARRRPAARAAFPRNFTSVEEIEFDVLVRWIVELRPQRSSCDVAPATGIYLSEQNDTYISAGIGDALDKQVLSR